MVKPAKPCIFCGKYGDQTKEHVLARWLEGIFPRHKLDTHSFGILDAVSDFKPAANNNFKVKTKQGRTHSRQARVVCGGCNGGWMGDNQIAAKPILTELIRGNFFNLEPAQQAIIALWSVRASMASEFLEGRTKSRITQQHRTSLMKGLSPPDGWFVWIGGYNGRHSLTGHEILSSDGGTLTPSPGSGPRTSFFIHGVTIGLGRLIIYAIGTDMPEQDFSISSYALQRIWPQSRETILWPPALLIDDQQEAQMSYGLLRTLPLNLPSGWAS